jgi:O-antigen ligase/Flp pilus assembly protein TadD
MRRFGTAVFSFLLVCPLFAAPGFGYDGVRLPAAALGAAVLLAALALNSARRRERSASADPLKTAGLILLGVQTASLAAARSVWEGIGPVLLTASGVAVYAFARSGLLRKEYVPETGAWAVAGVGLVTAAWGLIQKAGGVAPAGLEGNTNYSGTLAGMLLPPAAAFSFARAAPWKRALAGGGAAALAALLVVSESRAGLAGAAVGGLVTAFAFAARRVSRAALAAGAALVVLTAAPVLLQFGKHFSAGRLETLRARAEIWKGAAGLVGDRPWLGAGAGNFAVRYPLYRSEAEFRFHQSVAGTGFKEVEDAHSSWVQAAAEGGVPGLLALLLVAYVAARLWRYYAKTAAEADVPLLAGLGGGAAAFLAAGLFNTLTARASHTVLFWAFLGMIELVGNPRVGARRRQAGQAAVALPAAGAIAAVLGAWLVLTVALAERQVVRALTTTRDPEVRERLLRGALETFPAGWRAHYELGKTFAATGRFAEASDSFRAALRYRPHHLDALHSLAASLVSANLDFPQAEAALRHAVELAPYDARSHFNLGYLDVRRGRMAEARRHFEEALRRNPRHGVSSYYAGVTCLVAGDAGLAREHFRRARDAGFDVAAALRREQPSTAADPRFAEFFR